MKPKLIALFFLLCCGTGYAQTFLVKGKVTDEKGAVVPYASVYQKGTTRGTSANGDGEFQLRLPAGKITLLTKSVGFAQDSKELDLRADAVISIVLKTEVYQLQDVVLAAGEDPAYKIIRNAIKKRPEYLYQPSSYACDVYIKGLQKLLAAPKRFLGQNLDDFGKEMGLDSNRRGILYLSESESRYTAKQPNQSHEEMISSKVSGSNRAFSWNRASELDVNFYKNHQDWQGLTNRPLVSPIADNALSFYRYKLIGTTVENNETIYKIQVMARRKADPAFGGFIYILDDSWRIYGAELMLTKDANINFVDTVKVNQQFYPVKNGVWVPSTVRFDFVGGLFGFRFGGYYTAVYRNYDIEPEVPKKLFLEMMKVTKGVNKKDSLYWNTTRPVPLTAEEHDDYVKKEALAAKRESKPYLDSLDRRFNRFKPQKLLFGSGYTYRNRYRKTSFHLGSLVSSGFYNTVEGFGIDLPFSFSKQVDSATSRYFVVQAKLRYGFSSEKLLPQVGLTLPLKNLPVTITGGSDMVDLNSLNPQTTFGNTVNSLFYEQNRLKLYRKDFVAMGLSKRFGAVAFGGSAEWANRTSQPNRNDFTFRDIKGRSFTSNNPFVPTADVPQFPENQSFRISLRASYEFSKRYVTYPNGRFYLRSKYPTLAVNYTKGLKNILGSDVDYDLLAVTLSKSDVQLGMYGRFSFFTGAGKFIHAGSVFYPDFKHFAGNQSLSYKPRANGFLFLPFYTPATADEYVQLNTEHNFGGMFLNRVPGIRKLKLQEIAGFNYLATPGFKNYKEYYFGLQYLSFRALYGFAYQGSMQVDRGLRLVISM